MIGIYKITSPSNKVYIGQSTNINQRFSYYRNLLCKYQPRLLASFIKHGVNNHKFEIIEECDVNNLDIKERFYQEKFDCIGKNGLNCSLKNTNEKRLICSDYTKKKLSKSRRKRVITQATKDKMSKTMSGRTKTPEHIEKVAEKLRGYKHSDETKKNMSLSKQGFKVSQTQKDLQSKKVIRISDGAIFKSAKEASKKAKINYSCFTNKLNGCTKVNDTGYEYLHGKTTRGQRLII